VNLFYLLQKPQPYEADTSIWTDKFINPEMHEAHLDPSHDAASFCPERREKVCINLIDKLNLSPGKKLLDLGCGPGLYSRRFAQEGISVTGIDISGYSLSYAREQAEKAGLDITYILSDYREPLGAVEFDAAVIIYKDYGVMSYTDRITFLKNVNSSLRIGGKFALDVHSDKTWGNLKEKQDWYTSKNGFLRPHPHTVINKTWVYQDDKASCDVSVVIDDKITRYITWDTYFTPERITSELESAGFAVDGIMNSLEGIPYDGNDIQLAVFASKRR